MISRYISFQNFSAHSWLPTRSPHTPNPSLNSTFRNIVWRLHSTHGMISSSLRLHFHTTFYNSLFHLDEFLILFPIFISSQHLQHNIYHIHLSHFLQYLFLSPNDHSTSLTSVYAHHAIFFFLPDGLHLPSFPSSGAITCLLPFHS